MSNILNEYDVKGIEEHLTSLSKEGVMKITINLFKGYGELADKHNQLESVLNEAIEYIKHSWWLRTDQTYDTSKCLSGWEAEELLSILERGKE